MMRVLTVAAVLALACTRPVPSLAQAPALVMHNAPLMVQIRAHIASDLPESQWWHGAGIVVGHRGDTLFVATARHLLCGTQTCTTPLADSVVVYVRGAPARPLVATGNVLDPEADLAFLIVPNAGLTGLDPATLPMARLGAPDRVRTATTLYPMGCATSVDCWATPLTAGSAERGRGPMLQFRLMGLERGYSGGPVFTLDGELVGMTIVETSAGGKIGALRIDTIQARLQRLANGAIPFMLHKPRVPLRGYTFQGTVGVVAGWTTYPRNWTGAGYIPVTGIELQGSRRVLGRLSAMGRYRVLTSSDLRSGTVAAGPQLSGKLTRIPDRFPSLAYTASLQGALSRVYAKHYVGGYRRNGAWTPIHSQVSTTIVGGAAAGAVQATLRPHVALVGGYSVDYYPTVRSDFPGVFSVFSLSTRLSF